MRLSTQLVAVSLAWIPLVLCAEPDVDPAHTSHLVARGLFGKKQTNPNDPPVPIKIRIVCYMDGTTPPQNMGGGSRNGNLGADPFPEGSHADNSPRYDTAPGSLGSSFHDDNHGGSSPRGNVHPGGFPQGNEEHGRPFDTQNDPTHSPPKWDQYPGENGHGNSHGGDLVLKRAVWPFGRRTGGNGAPGTLRVAIVIDIDKTPPSRFRSSRASGTSAWFYVEPQTGAPSVPWHIQVDKKQMDRGRLYPPAPTAIVQTLIQARAPRSHVSNRMMYDMLRDSKLIPGFQGSVAADDYATPWLYVKNSLATLAAQGYCSLATARTSFDSVVRKSARKGFIPANTAQQFLWSALDTRQRMGHRAGAA